MDRSLDDFLESDDDGSHDGGSDDGSDDDGSHDGSSDEGAPGDPGGSADAEASATDGEPAEASATDGESAESVTDVEPAESTYVRDPAGGTCVACGETVERRWRGAEGLVCPDCKEW